MRKHILFKEEAEMQRVIVTGANGFIGSSLIKKLIKKEICVVAADISFASSKLPESGFIQTVETGLEDASAFAGKIPGGEYDAFYHFAWQGVNGADKADPLVQLNNIKMMLNCAAAAKQLGCKRFLCAGTVAERAVESLDRLKKVGGGMMYGSAKHAAHIMLETYCKNIGLDFVWMQFSNIYGPENKTGNLVSYTLGQLMKGEAAAFGPAKQPYDLIYVEDLIAAILKIGEIEQPRSFYFIGSGEPHILGEYLTEIGRLFGREDLIRLGERPDDGVVYRKEMFDVSPLKEDIGNYVSMSFLDAIEYTIKNY